MQMELGGPSHEACAGIVALTGYLRMLAQLAPGKSSEAHGGDADRPKANGHSERYGCGCGHTRNISYQKMRRHVLLGEQGKAESSDGP